MYRTIKQYRNGKQGATLKSSIMYFEKFIKRKYGKKKINLLLEAFFPVEEVYTCLFEFKKAKLKSNQERVGVE